MSRSRQLPGVGADGLPGVGADGLPGTFARGLGVDGLPGLGADRLPGAARGTDEVFIIDVKDCVATPHKTSTLP